MFFTHDIPMFCHDYNKDYDTPSWTQKEYEDDVELTCMDYDRESDDRAKK